MKHTVTQVKKITSKQFKFGVTDYRVTLSGVHGRSDQQLCQQFIDVMNAVIDDVLKDAQPDDYVRFHVKSSEFDQDLNTRFQSRSNCGSDCIVAVIDKTLQSHMTIWNMTSYSLYSMRKHPLVGSRPVQNYV